MPRYRIPIYLWEWICQGLQRQSKLEKKYEVENKEYAFSLYREAYLKQFSQRELKYQMLRILFSTSQKIEEHNLKINK